MFRLQGHVLRGNQVIWTALTTVFGIGRPTSKKLLEKFGIVLHTRVSDLTEDQQKLLSDEIKEMVVESDLKREIATHIKRLKEIRCYRGMRHAMWLPVRGQQTKTHAKTAKKLMGRSKVRPTLKK
jgi:small subunit ribosomal protein S13